MRMAGPRYAIVMRLESDDENRIHNRVKQGLNYRKAEEGRGRNITTV